jgi:hypothetical protein
MHHWLVVVCHGDHRLMMIHHQDHGQMTILRLHHPSLVMVTGGSIVGSCTAIVSAAELIAAVSAATSMIN